MENLTLFPDILGECLTTRPSVQLITVNLLSPLSGVIHVLVHVSTNMYQWVKLAVQKDSLS